MPRHNYARQRTERIRTVLAMATPASEARAQVFRDDPDAAALARHCLRLITLKGNDHPETLEAQRVFLEHWHHITAGAHDAS